MNDDRRLERISYGNKEKREFCAVFWEKARLQSEQQTSLEQWAPLTGWHPSEPEERQQAAKERERERGERKRERENASTNKHGLIHQPGHCKYSSISCSICIRNVGSSPVSVAGAHVSVFPLQQ